MIKHYHSIAFNPLFFSYNRRRVRGKGIKLKDTHTLKDRQGGRERREKEETDRQRHTYRGETERQRERESEGEWDDF